MCCLKLYFWLLSRSHRNEAWDVGSMKTSKKVLYSICNYMYLWLLQLTRCCLSQKILARCRYSVNSRVPTSQCGSELRKRPCDVIFSSQHEPEWTNWQGDYFGIWTQFSNYYAMPRRLIYCTPHNAGEITFWERDSGRLVFVCLPEWLCVRVCLGFVCLSMKNDTDKISSRNDCIYAEIKAFKKKKKGRLQGLILTLEMAAGRLFWCVWPRELVTVCVCVCGEAWGGSGGSAGARPSALSFTARPPSKSCTAPTGVPNSPSRSSAGLQ